MREIIKQSLMSILSSYIEERRHELFKSPNCFFDSLKRITDAFELFFPDKKEGV